MKNYIGKKVEFIVDGFNAKLSGKVIQDTKNFVILQGDDEYPIHILKNKIVMFRPLEAVDFTDTCLLVLACENPSIRCSGVQYIKEGEGFTKVDFEAFMKPCKKRCETCRYGSKGDLRTMDVKVLVRMLSGTVYGDYPHVN